MRRYTLRFRCATSSIFIVYYILKKPNGETSGCIKWKSYFVLVSIYQIYFTYSIYRHGEQIIVFFCSNRTSTLVAMAAYSFHWLIMGKVEIDIYCYFTVNILTKVLQNCSLSRPLWIIWILSKLIWKAKFAKKYKKIISSVVIRGMKLKLCRNVHNISLYKNFDFYCRCSCAFVAMTI